MTKEINLNKTIVKIKGMHCRSCEILIEDKLREIDGIKNVNVNWKKKEATIYSKYEPDMKAVSAAISSAGYEIGEDQSQNWISTDPAVYTDLVIAILVLSAIYIWGRNFGFNGFSPASADSSSLAVVFVVGLTAGISSCMALVGGLILGLSAKYAEAHPIATPMQKFRPHLFFILGRVIAYTIFGGIIGLLGQAFRLSEVTLGLMTIFAGLVMLFVGLQLTEIFPRLSNYSLALPANLSKKLGLSHKKEREYSHKNATTLGVLTILLPCGFTQAMMILAINSGSFGLGAAIMGVFALGTAPGLLGIGGLTSVIDGQSAKTFFKFAGVLVVALAFFNFSNGLALAGVNLRFSPAPTSREQSPSTVTMATDGSQIVKMTQSTYGYTPNSFTVKKGVPVKWEITSTDQNTCAASIYSAALNIQQFLHAGENIIEFTPTQTGVISFSCSMGMYRGSFNVDN